MSSQRLDGEPGHTQWLRNAQDLAMHLPESAAVFAAALQGLRVAAWPAAEAAELLERQRTFIKLTRGRRLIRR